MMTTEELLDLKKEIENAKVNASELKGERKVLLEKLSNDFGCDFDGVDDKLEEITNKVQKLEKEKDKIIDKLNEDYEF